MMKIHPWIDICDTSWSIVISRIGSPFLKTRFILSYLRTDGNSELVMDELKLGFKKLPKVSALTLISLEGIPVSRHVAKPSILKIFL